MYHSSATLLPDASIMIAGSNPNAGVFAMRRRDLAERCTDFIGITFDGISVNASDPFHTEYRVERFYPDVRRSSKPK